MIFVRTVLVTVTGNCNSYGLHKTAQLFIIHAFQTALGLSKFLLPTWLLDVNLPNYFQ